MNKLRISVPSYKIMKKIEEKITEEFLEEIEKYQRKRKFERPTQNIFLSVFE